MSLLHSRARLRPSRSTSLLFILICVAVLWSSASPRAASAGDNDALAKEIEQLIRTADKELRSGQIAMSGEKLAKAEQMLAELKQEDPRHRAVRPLTARLSSAMKKYEDALAAASAATASGGVEAAAGSGTGFSSGGSVPAGENPGTGDSDPATGASDPDADARLMMDLYDEYYPQLDLIHGNSLVYGVKDTDAQAALDQIEAAEALLPEFAAELGRLADAYGTEALEIGNNLHRRGVKISGDPGGRLAYLIEATGKVGKSRQASAAACAHNAEMLLGNHSGPVTDARLKRLDEVKRLLMVGQKLDPNNAEVAEMLGTIDDQIAAASLQMEAEIDAATWAGHVANFGGPGDVSSLATEALSFFRKHDGWGGRKDKKIEVLDVCVRGPWQVAERDVFGRVIAWRLPIHVAVTDPELRPRNIARVYDLSILAMEGAPNAAPKAPPYAGYWVGSSWMMRLDGF